MRHTHASLMFEAGVSIKSVQSRLGHSDYQTTADIYTHVTKKAKTDMGTKFAKYVDF
jgi:site-specific recombinase XerD